MVKPRARLKGRWFVMLFFGLLSFHLAVSCLFYGISIRGYFPSLHDGRGIWNYAKDSRKYDEEAVASLCVLRENGFLEWWKSRSKYWHVKYIALMYWLLKPVPLAAAPLNAVLWAVSFLLVFSISFLILENEGIGLTVASVFSLFPSHLMDSIQLLQDPFYVLGALMFIQSWVWTWKGAEERKDTPVRWLPCMVFAAFGFYLVVKMRLYLMFAWLGMAFLFYLATLVRYPRRWIVLTGMIVAVLTVFFNVKPAKPVKPIKPAKPVKPVPIKKIYPWVYSRWVPDGIEGQLIRLARYRERFCTCCPHAGSNIDTSVRFHSVRDVVRYLPRALEIGFLSPFPRFWFQRAKTSGRLARLIVGGEMVVLYLFYGGILAWLIRKGVTFEWVMLFFWGAGFILLFSLVVVNLGTLHRMRHIYLLPVFIYGTGGWLSPWRRPDKFA